MFYRAIYVFFVISSISVARKRILLIFKTSKFHYLKFIFYHSFSLAGLNYGKIWKFFSPLLTAVSLKAHHFTTHYEMVAKCNFITWLIGFTTAFYSDKSTVKFDDHFPSLAFYLIVQLLNTTSICYCLVPIQNCMQKKTNQFKQKTSNDAEIGRTFSIWQLKIGVILFTFVIENCIALTMNTQSKNDNTKLLGLLYYWNRSGSFNPNPNNGDWAQNWKDFIRMDNMWA